MVKKTATVISRVSAALKIAAKKCAAEDSRTLSSLVEKLLADHVQKGKKK